MQMAVFMVYGLIFSQISWVQRTHQEEEGWKMLGIAQLMGKFKLKDLHLQTLIYFKLVLEGCLRLVFFKFGTLRYADFNSQNSPARFFLGGRGNVLGVEVHATHL